MNSDAVPEKTMNSLAGCWMISLSLLCTMLYLYDADWNINLCGFITNIRNKLSTSNLIWIHIQMLISFWMCRRELHINIWPPKIWPFSLFIYESHKKMELCVTGGNEINISSGILNDLKDWHFENENYHLNGPID